MPVDVGVAAVAAAHAAGINFYDTSPFYGITKSETVLGEALKPLPRDGIIVATKVGRYGQDEFDFSSGRVSASIVDSLRRLGLDRLDIVHCHDVEFGDAAQVCEQAIPTLLDLKAQRVIGAIGVTGYPLPALDKVLAAAPKGSVDIVLSYCRGCLADHALDAAAARWTAAGLGVINASPLSMGLRTQRGPPEWHPAPAELKAAARAAAAVAADAGFDIADLALRDALAVPHVASHLVGCGSPEVVEANVRAARAALARAPPAEAAALDAVRGVLAPVLGTTRPSGRPETGGP